jgi:hypothetical protein
MKKSFIILTYTLISCMLLSSCATIVSGSKQKVKFSSTPSNATIYVDETEVGKTPFEMKLKRNREHHIIIKLEGYNTYETTLKSKFNAWYLGNILIGGVIGLVIDPITGAMFKLSPKELNAELAKGTTFKVDKKNNIYIAVSLDRDSNWEKIGQLEKAR